MSSPKIGFFIDNYPPAVDGVSVCVENYCRWIKKKYSDVAVVVPEIPESDFSAFDYPVIDYKSVPIPDRHPYMMGLPMFDLKLPGKLRNQEFRLLHAHSPFSAGLVASVVARRHHIPLVATFHSKYRDDLSHSLPKPLVDITMNYLLGFFNRADEVWVPQESVIDVIREYGYKGPVEVVENGSDLVNDYPESFFSESREMLGVRPGELVLLFVGQHIWEKGIRLILDALAELADCPFRMFFIGEGYAAAEMESFVRESGTQEKVTFVGPLFDREKLTRYYAAADLFLFPSMYDNAPLVIKEAAALNSPAVMLEGATASAFIKDGVNGFLVAPDAHSMAARIRELASSRTLIRDAGKNACRTLVRSWEECVDEAVDRYDSLLKRKGLPPIKGITG